MDVPNIRSLLSLLYGHQQQRTSFTSAKLLYLESLTVLVNTQMENEPMNYVNNKKNCIRGRGFFRTARWQDNCSMHCKYVCHSMHTGAAL